MNFFNKLVVLSLAVCSLAAQAEIKVSLHNDLEVLVLNKKNVGYKIFGGNEFSLKDGENQIVVRVAKLLMNQGYKEKFKSEPVVLTFDLNNANLEVSPERSFLRYEQIEGFDENPVFIVTNNGKTIKVEQGLLERGVGMTRDYAAELKVYNEDNNIVMASAVAKSTESAPVVTKPVAKVPSSPVKMSQDLFVKASDTEKEQFTDWAFKNRKSINSSLDAEGKVLPMLEYWYEKADADEKAEILTWILAL